MNGIIINIKNQNNPKKGEEYEKKENDRDIVIQTTLPLSFKKEDNEIENCIKELNILELTPIDAINILNDLKMKVKDNER